VIFEPLSVLVPLVDAADLSECLAPAGGALHQFGRALEEAGGNKNDWHVEQSRDGNWWFKLEKGGSPTRKFVTFC
jgi:hypothetical protein